MTGLAKLLREKWYLDEGYSVIVHKLYLPFTAMLQQFETVAIVKGALRRYRHRSAWSTPARWRAQ